MKIGILTFHYSNHNYGAVLQTYSIYKLIESLGHDSYIINYKPKITSLRKKILNSIKNILGYEFEIFRHKYIPGILPETQNVNDLKKLNNLIDGFIVGSDQVWRYRGDKEAFAKYFFDFVNDDKLKIAYGASFGVDSWYAEKNITNNIKKLIKKFDAISVREESGIKICEEIFNINSVKVLDPTLLVKKKYFHELADKKFFSHSKKKYLAYMILDNNKKTESFFRKIATNNQLKFIQIKGKNILPQKDLFFYNNVNKWLNYIKYANIIVTDSFHCTIFSIIFQKKFICLSNPIRGTTRLKNLLEMVKLESRLYSDINKIKYSGLNKEIDYSKVEILLNKEKIKSTKFLRNSLKLH
jgi:hypothetical protein